jgi:hypothetical protein
MKASMYAEENMFSFTPLHQIAQNPTIMTNFRFSSIQIVLQFDQIPLSKVVSIIAITLHKQAHSTSSQ